MYNDLINRLENISTDRVLTDKLLESISKYINRKNDIKDFNELLADIREKLSELLQETKVNDLIVFPIADKETREYLHKYFSKFTFLNSLINSDVIEALSKTEKEKINLLSLLKNKFDEVIKQEDEYVFSFNEDMNEISDFFANEYQSTSNNIPLLYDFSSHAQKIITLYEKIEVWNELAYRVNYNDFHNYKNDIEKLKLLNKNNSDYIDNIHSKLNDLKNEYVQTMYKYTNSNDGFRKITIPLKSEDKVAKQFFDKFYEIASNKLIIFQYPKINEFNIYFEQEKKIVDFFLDVDNYFKEAEDEISKKKPNESNIKKKIDIVTLSYKKIKYLNDESIDNLMQQVLADFEKVVADIEDIYYKRSRRNQKNIRVMLEILKIIFLLAMISVLGICSYYISRLLKSGVMNPFPQWFFNTANIQWFHHWSNWHEGQFFLFIIPVWVAEVIALIVSWFTWAIIWLIFMILTGAAYLISYVILPVAILFVISKIVFLLPFMKRKNSRQSKDKPSAYGYLLITFSVIAFVLTYVFCFLF